MYLLGRALFAATRPHGNTSFGSLSIELAAVLRAVVSALGLMPPHAHFAAYAHSVICAAVFSLRTILPRGGRLCQTGASSYCFVVVSSCKPTACPAGCMELGYTDFLQPHDRTATRCVVYCVLCLLQYCLHSALGLLQPHVYSAACARSATWAAAFSLRIA
jgi:hypothetical protein